MSPKYPRTPHLPWSPGGTPDDKTLYAADHFVGRPVVITEKLDGSNVTMTSDEVFARSHAGPPGHPSFDYAKARAAQLRHAIPPGVSVFFEYCFAVHSIVYDCVPVYLFVIGVRDDESGLWWDWEATELMAADLGLITAPVLYRGIVESEDALVDLTGSIR
jgi:hypothetical protein